jgi:hypothetical protein
MDMHVVIAGLGDDESLDGKPLCGIQISNGGAHRLAEARGGNRERLNVLQQSVERFRTKWSAFILKWSLQSVDVPEVATMARLVHHGDARRWVRRQEGRSPHQKKEYEHHSLQASEYSSGYSPGTCWRFEGIELEHKQEEAYGVERNFRRL